MGDNLCVEERAHVRAAVEGLVLALLLFWSVPISFLQAVFNWEELQSFFHFPDLGWQLVAVLEYLPVFVTNLTLAFIPTVIWAANKSFCFEVLKF